MVVPNRIELFAALNRIIFFSGKSFTATTFLGDSLPEQVEEEDRREETNPASPGKRPSIRRW